jgi:hypothetical protein
MSDPTFAVEFVVPVEPDAMLASAVREFVPFFGQEGFQMTAQTPTGLTLTRRYLGPGAFIGGLLTFPLGILIWALVRKTQTVNFSFSPMGSSTRVVASGQGPRSVHEYVALLKEHSEAPLPATT